MDYEFILDGEPVTVTLERDGEGYRVSADGQEVRADVKRLGDGTLSLILGDRVLSVHTATDGEARHLSVDGVSWHLAYPSDDYETGGAGGGGGDGLITTPMPGKVVEVRVQEGDEVVPDQPLLVLESMKMQNDILSDVKGVVKKIHFQAGDQAGFGEPLVEIEVEK